MMRHFDALYRPFVPPLMSREDFGALVDDGAFGDEYVAEADVCLAGNPAQNGRCGDSLCVCHAGEVA